ncbi:hypothetical protein D3C84_926010 [compost metagenome]
MATPSATCCSKASPCASRNNCATSIPWRAWAATNSSSCSPACSNPVTPTTSRSSCSIASAPPSRPASTSSSSVPALAPASIQKTAVTSPHWSRTPTQRCIAPKPRVVIGSKAIPATSPPKPANASRWNTNCGAPSSVTSCSCTISQRSAWKTIAWSAPKRSFAGATRPLAMCRRSTSFPWPKKTA